MPSFPVREPASVHLRSSPPPADVDEMTHSFRDTATAMEVEGGNNTTGGPPLNTSGPFHGLGDMGRSSIFSRTSLDRTGNYQSKVKPVDEAIDEYFDEFLNITAPLLPVQTLFISFHIMQKRARQFLDDARFFALQQFVWLLTALVGLIVPKNTNTGIEYASEVYFALVLVMSSLEMVVYIIGHGFFAGEKFGRTAHQLRVLAVLGVWSPPRFRRKGDIAVQHYQVQMPLLSNAFMRIELSLVILSIIGYFLEFDGIGRVRFVHVLRSARLIYGLSNIWPLMVRVIATFQASLAGMSTALVLLLFFFILFGITGVDQFSDSLSNRCVLEAVPTPYGSYNRSDICIDGVSSGCVEASPILYCDIDAATSSFTAPFVCRGNMVCRTLDPPNYGYTSFNDFFHAAILMIQLTSLTEWSTFMYGVWMSNPSIFVGVYCAVLIIVVSYVVLNFVVATICSAYSEHRNTATGYNKFTSISLLNFRFTEFVWWTISIDAQYYLSFANPTSRHQNRRSPFYEHRNYKLARDMWLTALVASHATLTAGSTNGHTTYLSAIEVVNMVLFSLDVIVSIVAAGSFGKYLIDEGHRFDLLAFIMTIVGLIIKTPLSVFRFVLVGHWLLEVPMFRNSRVIQQGLVAAPGTLLAALVLLLLLFVSASVAVQLFSVDTEASNNDWGDSWQAIVTLFRFVTLDGWATIMYEAMLLRGPYLGLGFFLPTYIMFGYMIRGLFTSVVVDAFDPNNEEKLAWQQKAFRQAKRHGLLGDGAGGTAVSMSHSQKDMMLETFDMYNGGPSANAQPNTGGQPIDTYGALETVHKSIVDASFFYFRVNHPLRRFLLRLLTVSSELVVPEGVTIPRGSEAAALLDEDADAVIPASLLIPYKTYGNYFQLLIILFVLGSCVTAADPATEACTLRGEALKSSYSFTSFVWLDGILVAIFTVEMLMRMIAFGVIMKGDDRPWYVGPTYFGDAWNSLDFVLLLIMYISIFYPEVAGLRLMRILRPLRIIRRFRRMRLLMSGVVMALPGIFVTILCGGVMLFLFAIVGVSRFRGKMDACSVTSIGGAIINVESQCTGMLFGDNGVIIHAVWEQQDPNFDSVVKGMSYLIQIISLSSWTDLLARATSVTDANQQPRPKAALENSLFFFVFVILSNSYVLNIIVGVVVAAFDEQRGLRFLTLSQRMYRTLREAIENMRTIPAPPSSKFPKLLALVRWSGFDPILNVVVILNIGVLLSTYSNQSETFTNVQFYLNTMFTFVFVVEACLKILALGRKYFYDLWNNLDFAIVAGSIVEFSIQMASSGQAVTITSVGRAFRILRVFRSVRRVPSLQMMFSTLANSTPAILSIFGVMIIVVFMYSVVGMQMFGQLRFQTAIDLNSNFRNFMTGWFSVFRMLTLDEWDLMMRDAATYVGDYCSLDQTGWWYLDSQTGAPQPCGVLNDCGSTFNAQFYFFSFYVLSAFIFTSVVIAILLDSFRLSSSSSRAAVRHHDLEGFRRAWLSSRRALGERYFYGQHLEKELMSLLIIALFNDNNGLALNRADATRHVHPALTSRTRLNFRKIMYELDYMTHRDREHLRRKLKLKAMSGALNYVLVNNKKQSPNQQSATETPPEGTPSVSSPNLPSFDVADAINDEVNVKHPQGKYSFHDVLECLCRFQMGQDALPLEQKVARETFDDKMNVALFSAAIKSNLLSRLKEARGRLQLYELQDASPMLLDAAISLDEVIAVKRQRSSLLQRRRKAEEEEAAADGVASDDRGGGSDREELLEVDLGSPFNHSSPRGGTMKASLTDPPPFRLPQPQTPLVSRTMQSSTIRPPDPRSILKKSPFSPISQPTAQRGAVAFEGPDRSLHNTAFQEFGGVEVNSVGSDDEGLPPQRGNNHSDLSPPLSPQQMKRSAAYNIVWAEEQADRCHVAAMSAEALEALHRNLLESSSRILLTDIMADSKRAWLQLLFQLRTATTTAQTQAPIVAETLVATPWRRINEDYQRPSSSLHQRRVARPPTAYAAAAETPPAARTNPMALLDVPSIVCPDDANCPLYSDPRHTAVRRHTCRKGAQCHNYTSAHAAQFLHTLPAEIEMLSSDDEMMELSV